MFFLKSIVRIAFIFVISLILPPGGNVGLTAATLGDGLVEDMATRGTDEFVRVVIFPVSDHNPAIFKISLAQAYRTRAERHRVAVEELKDIAARSQAPVRTMLNRLEVAGLAGQAKYFWIDNVIETEITPAALEMLQASPDIDAIDIYPTIVAIPSDRTASMATGTAALASNLKAVRADSAWALGYDGSGRIVCNFDSGVDGLHPALAANYRGNKGYLASECWFSSVDSSTYPHAFPEAGSSYAHGTHTTGIMIGHDDATGDTIGVAPGADWIAAVAIDVPGASIFESFQWAADPDGNPNTVSDIPDVINHSYGIRGIGCSDLLWGAIDHLEALGVVNIFSAGNEATAVTAIRNPANRAEDSVTNFAVGAINAADSVIWTGSSRGPSECDGVSIKPNVVAPGYQVNSSEPNGVYAERTGTSMSAPHVSGAVVILRQKNPDATADQIKTALLNSTHDLGAIGPDNTYGWGLIDIVAALEELDALTTPSLEVSAMDYPEIAPGSQVDLSLTLKNIGASVNNVTAVFNNPDDGLTILTDEISFGTIATGETVDGSGSLVLTFDGDVLAGRFYSLDMTIEAAGGYEKMQRLSLFIGPRGERTYFHHDAGRVAFTISNYGAYGFHENSYIPLGFLGFQLGGLTNDLFEGAFLIGTDSTRISDCARNIAQEPDNDFTVVGGGSMVSSSPGVYADQETRSKFDDSWAEHPLGVTIEQRSFGWASAPDNEYVILEYIITNNSDTRIDNFRTGLYFDWDLFYFSQNHGGVLEEEDIGYLCWASSNGADSTHFRGVRVLNREGMVNHRIYYNFLEVYGSNFTEGRKYRGLFDNSQATFTPLVDVAHITATGPFSLDPGEVDTAAFAIIGGDTWAEFVSNGIRAQQTYNDLPTDAGDDPPIIPAAFELFQNYPNPFNPATTIAFTVPQAGRVRVDIFDILGRNVTTLADGTRQPGLHRLVWDGTDESGHPQASGVYFYRVTLDDSRLTRKMILMK